MSKLMDRFERATGPQNKRPDMLLNLEIADSLNQSRKATAEGVEYFKQLLRSTNLHLVELVMALLDTCVKNCGMNFHYYANKGALVPALIKLLKRRRRKLNVLDKLAGLYKDKGWRKVEDQVLGLIQLWADTFMMHEDKYPTFMSFYRDLRKEGLKFPPRQANERFLIRFEGEASPAFELAEFEAQHRSSQAPVRPPPPKKWPIPSLLRPKPMEKEPRLSSVDISTLKRCLPLLEELVENARSYEDLHERIVLLTFKTCRRLQKKLVAVVSYEAGQGTDTRDLLAVLDYVNERMTNVKLAIDLMKSQGAGPHIKQVLMLGTEKTVDLLDLGTDNPLNRLDWYEAAQLEAQKEPSQSATEHVLIDLLDLDAPQGTCDLNSRQMSNAPLEEQDFFTVLASRQCADLRPLSGC
jgi:hypothetical protein